MNFSRLFIQRPVGTTLLAIGVFLIGSVAYGFLPVASLPSVDIPTIFVRAGLPGADPATVAATVAAPLERHLAEIAGVTELTSTNSLGTSSIVVQFDLARNVDHAARDVQAALNAAAIDLPTLPQSPIVRKANPAAAPILFLALTSTTLAPSALYDIADTVIAPRISQVEGVGQVSVTGAMQPAIRVRVDPSALAAMGLGLEDVRNALVNSNPFGPIGMFDGATQAETIATNHQLRAIADYDRIVVRSANNTIVRLSDVAVVGEGALNTLSAAWFGRRPAVLINVSKQANANVIATADRVHRALGGLKRWIPADIAIAVLSDRTATIRASVREMQVMFGLSIVLVVAVIFLFLRRGIPTFAAGVAVPLSLAGTSVAMWAAGFSVDNLSLMALVISIGLIVDDAIVMIENVFRNLEAGMPPRRATLKGARQIGFTLISINVSVVAVFIPVMFMGGIVGRFLIELSVTVVFAIAISTIVALSVIPTICAHFVRSAPSRTETLLDRAVDRVLSSIISLYGRTLRVVLDHRVIMLIVIVAIVVVTVGLYVRIPKGFIPQDDTGLVVGTTVASPDISFAAMSELQQRAAEIVMGDPAVLTVASSVGGGNGANNQGRLYVSLAPIEERRLDILDVIDRLRQKLSSVAGLSVYLVAVGDIRVGGRQSRAQYQFTLWGPDVDELQRWVPRIIDRLRQLPGLTDVSSDREQGGLQADIVIDRAAAARLCVRIQDIDNALNDAFAQRQVSAIYS
jgi:multidrug efflux pump